MFITTTNYTVADFCATMERKEIVANPEYQRSDKVWPPAARAFLIETILLGYPIPKLSLFQRTDVKSRKTYKEIVDGQQRSRAIRDFYDNKLRLPKKSEIPNASEKLYSQLEEDLQQRFLDYSLSVDLFVSATTTEIRETFRRINSYTVPLNPEEQLHSIYQGAFKWFVYNITKLYDQNLIDIGVFGEKQLARMADAKLFSEITHAFLNGITTTDAKKLTKLYSDFDRFFQDEHEITERIENAIDIIIGMKDIHKGPLMKPYNFYALLLAISHRLKASDRLNSTLIISEPGIIDMNNALLNLTALAESLHNPEDPGVFKEFIQASSSKTNVKDQRETRFRWFCNALGPVLL